MRVCVCVCIHTTYIYIYINLFLAVLGRLCCTVVFSLVVVVGFSSRYLLLWSMGSRAHRHQ